MVRNFKILFFLLTVQLAQAQIADTTKVSKKNALKILPVAYFMPETRIGAGALLYSVFRLHKSDTISRYSNFQTYASFTQNKQFAIENEWQLFSRHEKYIYSGLLDYTRFPEFFYGIGNNTVENHKELYSFDLIHFQSKNVKHLNHKFFAGLQYDLQYLFNVKDDDKKMMNEQVVGSKGYTTSTLGAILMYDTRDNMLNARKGAYGEILFSFADKFTLSQYKFQNLIIDFRKYIAVNHRFTFAIHAYGNFNNGTVPFRVMPALGGARYLRGYYKGRFRDNNLLVFQAETRIDLFWKLGMTLFGGVGQVADKIKNFENKGFKYNFGTGIRYKLNQKDNVNLRLDVGFTKEGYGLYVVFAEAF